MAGRFGESNNILIQSLKENAKNKNTQQSTNNWVKVWKSWAAQKGYDDSIEKYEPEGLNKILEEFYATVRKKDEEDYEPDSLRVMVTAIDRYLTEKEYKHSIIRDKEFKSSKQVLEGKARLLRQQGKGKRPSGHPPKLRTTGPLYLSCVSNPSSQVWYKRQPMGENKINGMMKSVIEGTSLEDSSKTFSNHSARKTVVKKLKTPGLERSSIVKVTGHRNEKSLDDFDEGDESEQQQLSHTISNARNINSQLARGNSSTPVSSTTSSSSNFNPFSTDVQSRGNNFNQAAFAFQMPSYISGQNDPRQCFMNINHFHQCQVTFNMGNTAAPEKPQPATPHGEDSIFK